MTTCTTVRRIGSGAGNEGPQKQFAIRRRAAAAPRVHPRCRRPHPGGTAAPAGGGGGIPHGRPSALWSRKLSWML